MPGSKEIEQETVVDMLQGRGNASVSGLQLAVVGTDIREDLRRYSVFIIEVRWTHHAGNGGFFAYHFIFSNICVDVPL